MKDIDSILSSLEYNICGQPLVNFPIECVVNWLPGGNGIYGIICLATGMVLVGEGKIGCQYNNRLIHHIGPPNHLKNKLFREDREKYDLDQFKLLFYKYENDPLERLRIEAELQKYYLEQNLCYNTLQRVSGGKHTVLSNSGFRGVNKKTDRKNYNAEVKIGHGNSGNGYYLGSYLNPEIAAQIYDYFVFHKRLSKPLNFPNINYNIFDPPKDTTGKYNKYIQEILDSKK